MPLIAVIDDDESFRFALEALLRSYGYRVAGHSSATQFLTCRTGEAVHCIVTDIQMPGLTGLDLKKQLDRLGDATPVVMITARLEASVLANAEASGAICVLRKPFEGEALIKCLDRALAA